ncbi:FCD domain-containing protein [Streptomyces sp. NPDC017940]|uniref:FCD domain-containing protein n=1 Tax=Streptomyces sp. NPDC017940 TaxID=3365017 RepID=UPI0037A5514C
MSGNDLLVEVYDYLGTALSSSLGGLPWDAVGAEEHSDLHRRLVDAIEARDESGARATAAAIVRLTRDHEAGAPRAAEEE